MLDRIAAELAQDDPDLDLMMSGWQARLTPRLVLAQLSWLGVSAMVVAAAAVVESALMWPIVALLLAALSMQGLLALWGRWR
jgi:hypothetical protein